MIREEGCVAALLDLVKDKDIIAKRDATFALANLCESAELQGDLVSEGALDALNETSNSDDARYIFDMHLSLI